MTTIPMTIQSLIKQVSEVAPLSADEAKKHEAVTRREATQHGHSFRYRGKEDEHLTRSNCAACVIAGYGADVEGEAPNHVLWFRDYVTLRKPVPAAWLASALLDWGTNRNESAQNFTLRCLRTFGLTTYVDGKKTTFKFGGV